MTPEEIDEKYDALTICGLKSDNKNNPFTDNMEGHCDECGAEIIWRPHSPHGPNVFMACLPCALKIMGGMKEEPEIIITPKCREEMEDIIAASKK